MELQVMASQLHNRKLQKATADIKQLETASNRNLFKIALLLQTIEENKLYEDDGFKSTADYGQQVLGYKKSSVSTMVRVAQRFIDERTGETVFIHQPGNDYSMFQLTELLTLSDESIGDLLASGELYVGMTQSAIRQLVKQERIRIGAYTPREKKEKEPTHIFISEVEAENLVEAPEEKVVVTKAMNEMDGKKMSDIVRQLYAHIDEYPPELIQKVLLETAEFLQAKGF